MPVLQSDTALTAVANAQLAPRNQDRLEKANRVSCLGVLQIDRPVRLFLFCLLLAAGCGEQKQPTTPANEIARVGDVSISKDVFEALLNIRARSDYNNFTTTAAKEKLLDELVRREAVFAKAKAAGFDQRPEVQESVRRLIASKFQEEQMQQEAFDPTATEQEIEQYYEEHKEKYAAAAKARGAILFLKISPLADAEKRAVTMAKAQSLLDQAKAANPNDFALLVQANSEDQATRYRAGDIGWISRDSKISPMNPAVTEALLALQNPGDFAPLVPTQKGVYIVKLVDTQSAGARPLKEVKDAIAYALRKQKLDQREQDFFASMKADLDIRINRPLLESIQPPASSPKTLPATPAR